MKLPIISIIIYLFFASSAKLKAQNADVSVQQFTGSANVFIPLYTVKSGGAVLPISLNYSSSGVKLKDIEGNAGMGWNVAAGGAITRQVRGIPDDCKKDNASSDRLGWLYSSNGTSINSWTISNDNSAQTCTDESSDINYINTKFTGYSDTEPDIFFVSAPGLAFKFAFDANKEIKVLPYTDVKITCSYDDASGAIKSFTVVNDQGVTYDFKVCENATKQLFAANGGNNISYFKREYLQYKNAITYTTSWKLTRITDPGNNLIKINYTNAPHITRLTSKNLYLPGATSKTQQFSSKTDLDMMVVTSVVLGEKDLDNDNIIRFSYSYSSNDRDLLLLKNPVITNITGMGNIYNLIYNGASSTDNSNFKRYFLQRLSNVQRSFEFNYKSLNTDTAGKSNIVLPDTASTKADYWGYFNNNAASQAPTIYINPSNAALERYRMQTAGSNATSYIYTISGSNRDSDPTVVDNGMLTSVVTNDGGKTTLQYESNSYYDQTAGQVAQGAGVRVKQITKSDNLFADRDNVSYYTYNNPNNSTTSGKPLSLPIFAFTTATTPTGNNEASWTTATVRSDENLSSESNSVVYSNVKVSIAGAGKTAYEYATPATFWDQSVSAGDWTPTIINIARSTCNTSPLVNNDKYTYPFPANPNYEFEQGMLNKTTAYNDADQKVSETVYTYQRSYAQPTIVTGVKFDDNSTVTAYSKYQLLMGTGKLLNQTTTTNYNGTSGRSQTTVYSYASSQHKLPTLQQTTNSDGSIVRTNMKYVKDYSSATTSGNSSALYYLIRKNINIPVETYQQIEREGVNRTIKASLTLFSTFATAGYADLYLPSQVRKFVAAAGVTNFQPSSVSAGNIVYDSRYTVTQNYLKYDYTGLLQTKDDNAHHIETSITDHDLMKQVATFSNAHVDEIAFNDFDSNVYFTNFSGGGTKNEISRTGDYGWAMAAADILAKQLSKNPLSKNNTLSLWINSSTTGNLSVKITPTGGTAQTYTFTYPNTSNTYRYVEFKIPLSTVTSKFETKLQFSTDVIIDDLLFYPEVAEAITYTSNSTSSLTSSETNTNGVSTYYDYDKFGRPSHVYDQDQQIVKRTSYISKDSYAKFAAASIQCEWPNSNLPLGVPVTFQDASENDINNDGMVYTWDFGDGSQSVATKVSSYSAVKHTYLTAGTYTVKLSKQSPFYGTQAAQQAVVVSKDNKGNTIVTASDTEGGSILSIRFVQGNVVKYYFTVADLVDGKHSVPMDNYTVVIIMNGGQQFSSSTNTGYKSVSYTTESSSDCQAFKAGKNPEYSFDMNLVGKASLHFSIDISTCKPAVGID